MMRVSHTNQEDAAPGQGPGRCPFSNHNNLKITTIMKKLFIMIAASALLFTGCDNDPNDGNNTNNILRFLDPETGEMTVPKESGRLEIKIDSEVSYVDVKPVVRIVSGAGSTGGGTPWLVYKTKSGPEAGVVLLEFEYAANPTYENRLAEVDIFSDGSDNPAGRLTAKIVQSQIDRIALSKTNFLVPTAGTGFDVEVTSNVEYEVEIEASAQGWITEGTADGDKHTFTANALSGGDERSGKITFKSTDGATFAEALIVQREGNLIDMAANVAGNRMWPKWENNERLMGMETITVEALINGNFMKGDYQLYDDRISTILGVENKFIFRVGDRTVYANQLELLWLENQPNALSDPNETLFFDRFVGVNTNNPLPEARIPQHTWTHVAATFDIPNTTVRLYINGNMVGERLLPDPRCTMHPVDLGIPRDDQNLTNNFWVGFTPNVYDEEGQTEPDKRFIDGMISEVRIWDRVLPASEFKVPNHFWSVDPNSDGLVAYWKFNDGTGTTDYGTIKDHSPLGNDLATRFPINWEFVSLP